MSSISLTSAVGMPNIQPNIVEIREITVAMIATIVFLVFSSINTLQNII